MEIERKFLISSLPGNLIQNKKHEIEQCYLCTDPVIRIRKQDEEYYLTYKSTGMLVKDEYEFSLTRAAYEHLKPKADGIIIKKTRYLIPYLQYTIELDIFKDSLSPLIIAEVEFPTVDEATTFTPPEWFAEDVTMSPKYYNSYLSHHGYSANVSADD